MSAEETFRSPVEAANRFIQAIIWGEHLTVWEMLSRAGRDHVLEAGGRRGLDAVQAQRVRQGTSPREEMDLFLTGLLQGLRVDFSSVELDKVSAVEPAEKDGNQAVVKLQCPAAFGSEPWAAGTVLLTNVDSEWRVDRIHPLVSRRE